MTASTVTAIPARLTRAEVYTRLGYKRSAGYKAIADLLANDPTFPRPIGELWREDHLAAWEDWRALAGLRAARAAAGADLPVPSPAPDAQPIKRGPGRPKRAVA